MTKKNESSSDNIIVDFNPSDNHVGNKNIGFNYDNINISKDINIKSMATVRFLDKERNRVLLEKQVKYGETLETDIYRTDYLGLRLDENGMAIGFKINDGRLGKDGIHKEYFSRVIQDDTDIECEMLRFDYYFKNIGEFSTKKSQIIAENNNDLSQKTFGFGDGITSLEAAFQNTSITSTPKMMVFRNIDQMDRIFANCTSIKSIGYKLFYYCPKINRINDGFYKCKSLDTIPSKLFDNNTDIAYCIKLFEDCELVSEIPNGLFDNFTKVNSLQHVFSGCLNIKEIPKGLLDNCINLTSVSNLFAYTSITSIPHDLFYNCINIKYFGYCFYGCKSLTSIPKELFEKCLDADSFSCCFCESGVKNIPENIFYNNLKASIFSWCFSRCPITEIPPSIFDKNTNATDFQICFGVCKNLTSIPQGLFDKNVNATSFNNCFWDCASVVTVPFNLFDNCVNVTDFTGCFDGCFSITSALPDAWNKEKFPNAKGGRYALGCTKAANYADIPSNFK